MLFNSIDFLIFFPIVAIVYIVIPKKCRCIWLLLASYYFYMSWNPRYALLILASTVITYASGILTARFEKPAYRKAVLAVSISCNLAILFVFKYANFFMLNVNRIFSAAGIEVFDRSLDLLLPVGISFYTFQALSYAIDVYKGDASVEKNFIRYALFVSFFPQLVAGPIERSGNLLTQIQNMDRLRLLDYERIRQGVMLMLWGLFQKIVIADRIAILVNTVYNNYKNYGFLEIAVATVLFAVQIYCDFGGYSDIAIGAAKVMGIQLSQNFRQPYFAQSINDFWKRWHISLTSWFTDYLYIPLGGNRKGTARKYLNILIVFAASGFWHGASWHFVAWGLLHAVYKVVGDLKNKLKGGRKGSRSSSLSVKIGKSLIVFLLVDFAWIFFASNSFRGALGMIRQMAVSLHTVGLLHLGLDWVNWCVLLISLLILLIVDILHEKQLSVDAILQQRAVWIRWIIVILLLLWIIMFGIYGTSYDASTFIYFQF